MRYRIKQKPNVGAMPIISKRPETTMLSTRLSTYLTLKWRVLPQWIWHFY